MNLPTVNGANARVAVWSQLGDRQPAYALVANVDLVVIRFDDQVAVTVWALSSSGHAARGGYVDAAEPHLRCPRLGLSVRHGCQRIQQ